MVDRAVLQTTVVGLVFVSQTAVLWYGSLLDRAVLQIFNRHRTCVCEQDCCSQVDRAVLQIFCRQVIASKNCCLADIQPSNDCVKGLLSCRYSAVKELLSCRYSAVKELLSCRYSAVKGLRQRVAVLQRMVHRQMACVSVLSLIHI